MELVLANELLKPILDRHKEAYEIKVRSKDPRNINDGHEYYSTKSDLKSK